MSIEADLAKKALSLRSATSLIALTDSMHDAYYSLGVHISDPKQHPIIQFYAQKIRNLCVPDPSTTTFLRLYSILNNMVDEDESNPDSGVETAGQTKP